MGYYDNRGNPRTNMRYCFLILNYLSYWETNNCIQSITKLYSNYEYKIVVVDNGSPNESMKVLNELYEENDKVHIISTHDNLGFASGNNYGFKWAKENYDFDYLICCNNDIVFCQDSFLKKIDQNYELLNYYILGPDIQKPLRRGVKHQNPHYPRLNNRHDIVKYKESLYARKEKIQNSLYFRCKCFLKEWLLDNGLIRDDRTEWKQENNKAVLHGACIVFSPRYISENEWLFYPGTFMYGEEQILYYLVKRRNESSLYSPDLQVMHMHGVSTKLVKRNMVEREIFAIDNRIKSIDVLLDLIEKDSKKCNE